MKYFLLIPILFPIICGFGLLLSKNLGSRSRNILVASVTIATSLLTFAALYFFTEKLTLIKFGEHLVISFSVDGLSVFFALIASVLWPPATFFAFEYMKHEGNESRFFGFWLMSFGVTVAVAFSANPLTMYLFYELLSLSTLPLVMHAMNAKSRYAGRNYLLFSMGGAALAFVSLIFLIESGADTSFILGGFLGNYDGGSFYLYSVVFIFGFIGYGVKAAIFPFSKWLADASVAPTPVTALLHAVAVVKAGIFAVIRLTWYSFGVAKLYGSFAQDVVLFFSAFTVLFGSYMALRTPHFKKRLAYSTVSNLSYMLIAVALMTGSALNAALMHMMFHALAKIVLFCCAGAVFYVTGREYIYQLHGCGRRMPITFTCFTFTALGLIGVPPLGNFTSKWLICTSAMEVGSFWAYFAAMSLMFSTLLTALYLLSVIIPAWFPTDEKIVRDGRLPHDPHALMTAPMILIAALYAVLSLYSSGIGEMLQSFIKAV